MAAFSTVAGIFLESVPRQSEWPQSNSVERLILVASVETQLDDTQVD
jgi:hypothetical protein